MGLKVELHGPRGWFQPTLQALRENSDLQASGQGQAKKTAGASVQRRNSQPFGGKVEGMAALGVERQQQAAAAPAPGVVAETGKSANGQAAAGGCGQLNPTLFSC
jgi:hypothetical protein